MDYINKSTMERSHDKGIKEDMEKKLDRFSAVILGISCAIITLTGKVLIDIGMAKSGTILDIVLLLAIFVLTLGCIWMEAWKLFIRIGNMLSQRGHSQIGNVVESVIVEFENEKSVSYSYNLLRWQFLLISLSIVLFLSYIVIKVYIYL